MRRSRPEELLMPTRSALLMIDIQNDFCHPKGRAANAGKDMSMMDGMLERSAQLLESARRSGVLVVHVQHTVLPQQASDAPAWRYFISPLAEDGEIVVEGSWGHEFMQEVRPRTGELILPKHRSSAFFNTRLDVLLRARQIATVAVCGVLAEGCVESTLRDAFHRDYYPVLAPDATASYSKATHSAYVQVVSGRHDSVLADELIRAWSIQPQDSSTIS